MMTIVALFLGIPKICNHMYVNSGSGMNAKRNLGLGSKLSMESFGKTRGQSFTTMVSLASENPKDSQLQATIP